MRLLRPSFALAFLAGAACVGNSGCSPDAPAADAATTASPEEKEASLQAKLLGDTGIGWKVIVDPRNNEVRFLSPSVAIATATPGGSPEERARGFFRKYSGELGVTDQEQLRLTDAITDSFGDDSVRFEHLLAGTDLPIFDSASVAEFTKDGRLLYLEPGFRRDLSKVARTAKIAQDAAEQSAVDHARASCGLAPSDAIDRKTSTLGVSAEPDAPAALAWAIDLRTELGDCVAPRVFVDATTGAVLVQRETAAFLKDRNGGSRFYALKETSDTKEIDVTQTLDVLGKKWVMTTEGASPKVTTVAYAPLIDNPIQTRTLGQWEASSPNRGAAVDGHYYAAKAIEYFKSVHGRSGLDGKGADITVVVHDPEKASHGENAHYSRGDFFFDDKLHVGDGGNGTIPFSAGFDVMAHELAHGVTAHSSKLIYNRDSGALNEAFSDVMGASAENWLPETTDSAKNVLIGERVTVDGRGFRNMADPSADLGNGNGGDVDHYKLTDPCPGAPTFANDFCGVHSNSGIANRAFTLMTLGGVHKSSKVAVAKGIGWEASRALWYNSFTKLAPSSNYPMAAYLQLAVAATQGPDVLGAVGCAWFAVGVLDPFDLIARNVACVGSNPAPPPAAPPTTASASGCNGRTSGYVCGEGTPGFAYACNTTAPGAYCADNTQQRKKTSPTDATASVAADGTLACE